MGKKHLGKKNLVMGGGKLILTAALLATLTPAAAFADVAVATDTKWEVPSAPMTNVVNVGGKDYKVITTQTATNWVTAGPDWLGISNSANLFGSNANTLEQAQTGANSLMGVWASSANEVPNAYNWNYFYNLWASENNKATTDLVLENNGTSFDSVSGTAAGLKYRPEIMWTDPLSTTSATSLGTMAQYIRDGKYFDINQGSDGYQYLKADGTVYEEEVKTREEGTGKDKVTIYETVDGEPLTREPVLSGSAAEFAAPNDDKYAPIEAAIYFNGGQQTGSNNAVMNSMAYNNPLLVANLLYSTAQAVEEVEKATADYDGKADGRQVTATNATWKTMNALPRTTRYVASSERPMTARDCALAFEQLQKGSVNYVLQQIALGKTTMKTVAYICAEPSTASNMVTIAAFDGADAFNASSNAGFAGVAPLCTNALKGTGTPSVAAGSTVASGATATYQVTVDYVLQNADYVVMTGVGSTNGTTAFTDATIRQFFTEKATTAANKAKAQSMQYQLIAPTQANAKNFSVDKSIYGLNVLDFVYADLFPNMELEAYWYDNIYHIKSGSLKQVMQWTLANTSQPKGTDLSKIDQTYSAANTEKKFLNGYGYYMDNQSTDARLKTLAAGTGLATAAKMDFSVFKPSDDYAAWAQKNGYKAGAYKVTPTSTSTSTPTPTPAPVATTKTVAQKLVVSNNAKTIYASSLSKGKLKKATSFTLKTTGNKGKVTYKVSSYSNAAAKKYKKYITVSSAGKVTVKKGLPMGTYTFKVKATAAKTSVKSGSVTTTYPAASKTVTVKVTVGAQTASVTAKATAKASTLKKKKVALSLTAKTTSGKITKVSNASTDKTAKKFTVKRASNKKITVTVPKGTKKGTYTLKVKVTAPKVAGKCLKTSVTKTVKITVK